MREGIGGEEGDSHEDVKRPPKDGLSKEASDPHPEDVWNLERGQGDTKALAAWGSGWIPGASSLTLILPTPHLCKQNDHSSDDGHQLPHQADIILGGHIGLLRGKRSEHSGLPYICPACLWAQVSVQCVVTGPVRFFITC